MTLRRLQQLPLPLGICNDIEYAAVSVNNTVSNIHEAVSGSCFYVLALYGSVNTNGKLRIRDTAGATTHFGPCNLEANTPVSFGGGVIPICKTTVSKGIELCTNTSCFNGSIVFVEVVEPS